MLSAENHWCSGLSALAEWEWEPEPEVPPPAELEVRHLRAERHLLVTAPPRRRAQGSDRDAGTQGELHAAAVTLALRELK